MTPVQAPDGTGVPIVDDRPENLLALEASLEAPPHPHHPRRVGGGRPALLADPRLRRDPAGRADAPARGVRDGPLIKSRPRTSHIPIIILTAIGRECEHQLRGYGEGAVDYL